MGNCPEGELFRVQQLIIEKNVAFCTCTPYVEPVISPSGRYPDPLPSSYACQYFTKWEHTKKKGRTNERTK